MAGAERTRAVIAYDDVGIDLIAEGAGPLVVLLPSRGRGSLDFDQLAAGIAKAGFRVLRPQPRGVGESRGPMTGLTLHDLARDVAAVIRHEGGGPAVMVGHAFGNWVARMTAVDHPDLVRGVAIVAAAAKAYPNGFAGAKELSEAVKKAGDSELSDAERLKYLQMAFFAPGNDPSVWLNGWYHDGRRDAICRRPRHKTVGMVVGRQYPAARPSGGRRSVQAANDDERNQG